MSGAPEPVFLTIAQVEALHDYALVQHGGKAGLGNRHGFESAVLQPQNTWAYGRGDLFDVAAAYAYHLAESQAFVDGNKRTGMAAALTFLRLNGITVTRHTDELHGAMIGIANRQLGKPELAAIFRRMAAR